MGIGLGAADPRADDPRQWSGEYFPGTFCRSLSNSRKLDRVGTPGLSRRFRTPAGNTGVHEISSAPQSCSLSAGCACHCPTSELSTYFSDTPADRSQDGLEITSSGVGHSLAISEHGPCLDGCTVTVDDVSRTTKIAVHSGGDAIAPYRCLALIDTGSSHTFIRREVLDHMRLVGADSVACEAASLRILTGIRLSVKFFRDNEPTCSLAD